MQSMTASKGCDFHMIVSMINQRIRQEIISQFVQARNVLHNSASTRMAVVSLAEHDSVTDEYVTVPETINAI
jgi:hypothetical protein